MIIHFLRFFRLCLDDFLELDLLLVLILFCLIGNGLIGGVLVHESDPREVRSVVVEPAPDADPDPAPPDTDPGSMSCVKEMDLCCKVKLDGFGLYLWRPYECREVNDGVGACSEALRCDDECLILDDFECLFFFDFFFL